jgi:SAM-dependent methyltransferase
MTKTFHAWAIDSPVTSPFGFPEGFVGYLAGEFMRLSYDEREIAQLLEAKPEHRVLEVGFGPGALLKRLHTQGIQWIAGVDLSERMLKDYRQAGF